LVVTDRGTYHPGEDVKVSQRIRNTSGNTNLEGATVRVDVRDGAGLLLSSTVRPVPTLPVTGVFDTNDLYQISASARPGAFLAGAEVRDASGQLLASSQHSFSVAYQPTDTVTGTLTVQSPFGVGQLLRTDALLRNSGGLAVSSGQAKVLLVDAKSLAVQSTGSAVVDLSAGGEISVQIDIPTVGVTTGQKLLVLMLDGRTLDRSTSQAMEVVDQEPPLVTISGVQDLVFTRFDVAPEVTITDQSAFSSTLKLDGAAFVSGTTVSGEGEHELTVNAVDFFGNAALRTVRFTIDKTPPQLTLAGPEDGAVLSESTTLSYTVVETNPGNTTSSHSNGQVVSAEGDYTWSVQTTDSAGNVASETRHFTIDLTAPSLSITVTSTFYSSPVSPLVQILEAHPGTTTVLLDGSTYVPGTPIDTEGSHTLEVISIDAAGNTSREEVHFTLDFTPPQIAINGAADGQHSPTPLTPAALVSDQNLASIEATLDGAPYDPGTPVTAEGTHTIEVVATDLAGNVTRIERTFTLDYTPPAVAVDGVANGAFLRDGASPTFSAEDLHLAAAVATLDGAPFTSGEAVVAEGTHTLRVSGVDLAGNATQVERTFVIDRTPPALVVTGVADGQFSNSATLPNVASFDLHPDLTEVTLDGAPYTAGTAVFTEGTHTLEIVSVDRAGNLTQTLITFTLDYTAPAVTVAGVVDGAFLRDGASPTFSAEDLHLSSAVATLDGAPFISGSSVLAEGTHTLRVTGVDLAGNSTQIERTFVIDRTPPAVSVSGVVDGQVSNAAPMPAFSASDLYLASTEATLDGAPFTPGTPVTAEGTHILVVTSTDLAGNVTQRQWVFTLDFTPPTVSIAGVIDGQHSLSSVSPTFSATDLNLDSVSATLNGAPFTSGTPVSTEGVHILRVSAVDRAGNRTEAEVRFTLDLTAPTVSIGGVFEGQHSRIPVSPTLSANDVYLASLSALLDGAPFTSGTSVSAEGTHRLFAEATDRAGNRAEAEATFTLDYTTPTVSISGVTEGQITRTSVSPTFSATDLHLASVSATIDGAPFNNGDTVSAEGPHSLKVTATDRAGNTVVIERAFTIDRTSPVITINGVSEGEHRRTALSLSYSATDVTLASVTATLNGATFPSGASVGTEGPHRLVVTATDRAGNTATAERNFVIDLTAPVVTVTGVTEGANADIFTPVFTATDLYLLSISATLDGAPFTSGTPVTSIGTHVLAVTAIDRAGNQTTVTRTFRVVDYRPSFRYAACAMDKLTVTTLSRVEGKTGKASVAANGDIQVDTLSTVTGDAVAGDDAFLATLSTVGGKVYYADNFTRLLGAAIGGSQKVTPAPRPCGCGYELEARLEDVRLHNDNARLLAIPSIASRIHQGGMVVSVSTVELPAGRYYLEYLWLSGLSRLKPAPGAKVELFVAGAVHVDVLSTLGALPNGAESLLVVSGADSAQGDSVVIHNLTESALLLYAPKADMALANVSTLHGAVVGRNVQLSTGQRLVSQYGQLSPTPLTCQ
jgi:hypothetical protein